MPKRPERDVEHGIQIIEGSGRYLQSFTARRDPNAPRYVCSNCGALYTTPNMTGRCERCILRDLEVPPQTTPFGLEWPVAEILPRYRAFRALWFGVIHSPDIRFATSAPYLTRGDGYIWEARHIEVIWEPSPVYLVARWYTEDEAQIQIMNFQHAQEMDRTRAWQAKRLVMTFKHVGRPHGSTTLTEKEFREFAPIARTQYIEKIGRPPSRSELAALLFIQERTLYDYIRNWPGVVP